MLIEQLSATALKGQSFTHALGKMTMFTGRNDAGKTARGLDAPRLALLGHLPELGKTNSATFALSSGSKLTVEATLSGHGMVRREWTQKGKTIKATSTGADGLPETPLVLLNAEEFLAKGDAERVKMLWGLMKLDPEKWTREALLKEVLEGVKGAPEAFIERLTAAFTPPEPQETVQATMERVADLLAAEQKAARAEVERWEKTAQGITQASLQEEHVDAQRVAADIEAAERALEGLLRTQGELAKVVQQQAGSLERTRELERRISALVATIGDRPLPMNSQETIEEQVGNLERLRGELAEKQRTAAEALEAYRRNQGRIQELTAQRDRDLATARELESRKAAAEDIEGKIAELEEAACRLEDASRQVQAASAAKAKTIAEQAQVDAETDAMGKDLAALLQAPCCPTCKRPGQEFRAAIEKAAKERAAELTSRAVQIGRDHVEACQVLLAAQEAQNAAIRASKDLQAHQRLLGDAQRLVQAARTAQDRAQAAKVDLEGMGDLEAPPEGPTAKDIEDVTTRLAARRDDLRRLRAHAELLELRSQLAQVQVPGEEGADERAATVADESEAQRERLEELKAQRQKASNQAADQRRLAQAEEERTRQEGEAKLMTTARAAVLAQREKMITATFGPFLEVANRFTKDILPTRLEYRGGEIGRMQNGAWVPVQAMGGTHRAVTYAGVQAALGASAPARLVLMDEMGRFDNTNKARFLTNVKEAITAGLVEQFIGIDVDPAPYRDLRALLDLTLVEVAK